MCIMLCMAAQRQTDTITEVIPEWTLGDRLRKARERKGLGVEEMATLLGRQRNAVTRYERSQTVDVNIVHRYASLTGISLRWILGEMPDPGDSSISGSITGRYGRGTPRGQWRDNRLFVAIPSSSLKTAA